MVRMLWNVALETFRAAYVEFYLRKGKGGVFSKKLKKTNPIPPICDNSVTTQNMWGVFFFRRNVQRF